MILTYGFIYLREVETEEIREIRRKATIAGLKLVDCPIRHLGTEKAQQRPRKRTDNISFHLQYLEIDRAKILQNRCPASF